MSIRIKSTKKQFSALSGLYQFNKLYKSLNIDSLIVPALPLLQCGAHRSQNKFEQLIYSFLAGAECLDDTEVIAKDAIFDIICNKSYTAKSLGNFLRSFKHLQIKKLNQILTVLAFKLREKLCFKDKSLTIDLDSTINKQYGQKIEGVGYAYNGTWGLDSIQAFDEYGLQYWNDVRAGGTFSAQGAETIIHEVFSRVPKTRYYKQKRLYFRADSAFCNTGVFNACLTKNAGFVICMRENMYSRIIKNIRNWKSQNKNDQNRIIFSDKRECEVAHTFYTSPGCNRPLRVVVIRARKNEHERQLIEHEDNYDYHAWITNIGEHELNDKKIIKFYRLRGQAENYIKNLKMGFDLKNYPCQKMIANKSYAIIAAFAANLMRLLSLKNGLRKAKYAKNFRNKWVYIPCQIVHKARYISLMFMNHHEREVNNWLKFIETLQYCEP